MKLKYYLRGLGIGIVVTALIMSVISLTHKNTLSDAEIIERAEKLGMVQSGVLSDDLGNAESTTENDASQSNTETQIPVADPVQVVISENEMAKAEIDKAEADKTDADKTEVDKAETDKTEADKIESDKTSEKEPTIKEEPEVAIGTLETGDGKTTTDNKTSDANKTDVSKTDASKVDAGKTDTKQDAKQETKPDTKQEGKTDSNVKPSTEATATTSTTGTNTAGSVTIQVNSGDGSRTVADRLKAAGAIDDAAVFDDFLCKNGYDRHITTGKHVIKAGATYKDIAQNLTMKVD